MLSNRPQWHVAGAVPEQSLLSQMLAMSWPQWPARKTCARGFLGCLEAFGEMGCLGLPAFRRRRRFLTSGAGKIQPPSYGGATHWGRLGSSILGLVFGVVGWLGEVSTPRGVACYSGARGPREGFSWRIGWPRNDQKTEICYSK